MQQANTKRSSGWAQARAFVMADATLQRRLAAIIDPDAFARALTAELSALGIHLSSDDVAPALRPDPLDTARFLPRPLDGTRWPQGPWLPGHAGAECGGFVDWLYFGEKRLSEPFFFESLQQMGRLPFNRAFRYRMSLSDFLSEAEHSVPPAGFIFHMSRCGSTLVAQMIAALPDSVVLSEPPPLDAILQMCRHDEAMSVDALRAMIAALGRRKHSKTPYVLKLDAWHVLALPLFQRAFPDVPWVFLYRDPVEVMVSQMRERGMQMVPAFVAPGVFGIEADVPDEDYCARVLAAMCRAGVKHSGLGGGLVINYDQLPEAVEDVILPHFGIRVDESGLARMRLAARKDAKQPYQEFTSDSADKQDQADEHLRALVRSHLADVYKCLEDIRQRQSR